jgi:hypothetical protein
VCGRRAFLGSDQDSGNVSKTWELPPRRGIINEGLGMQSTIDSVYRLQKAILGYMPGAYDVASTLAMNKLLQFALVSILMMDDQVNTHSLSTTYAI